VFDKVVDHRPAGSRPSFAGYVFEQMEQDWLEDDKLAAQANANDLENFALAFAKVCEASMLARLGKNEDLVMKILDAPEIKAALEAFYVERVYSTLRGGG
jgi:hypothetical protein